MARRWPRARRGPCGRDFARADELRDGTRRPGLDVRDTPQGPSRRLVLRPPLSAARAAHAGLRPQPVREALRGPRRGAARSRAPRRRRATRAGSDDAGVPVQRPWRRRRRRRGSRQPGPPGRRGPRRAVSVRRPPTSRSRRAAALVTLDGITDPQNLGAIARVASAPGADGLIVPRQGGRRDGRGREGIGGRGRASEGRDGHEPRRQAPRVRTPGLWRYGADAEAGLGTWEADLAAGTLFVLGSEGTGLRPRVRRNCDAASRSDARADRVAERGRRGRRAARRSSASARCARLTSRGLAVCCGLQSRVIPLCAPPPSRVELQV